MQSQHMSQRKSQPVGKWTINTCSNTKCLLYCTYLANFSSNLPRRWPVQVVISCKYRCLRAFINFVPRMCTYTELSKATKNFSRNELLGSGGFGALYEGTLPSGALVAVKRMKHETKHWEEGFQAEAASPELGKAARMVPRGKPLVACVWLHEQWKPGYSARLIPVPPLISGVSSAKPVNNNMLTSFLASDSLTDFSGRWGLSSNWCDHIVVEINIW